MRQNNRIVRKRLQCFPRENIPLLGFGSDDVTCQSMGDIFRGAQKRAFLMACGCVVTKADECGGACVRCMVEIEETLTREGCEFDHQQLRWLATSCKRHTLLCSYPLCGMTCCLRHAAIGPSGVYCQDHFLMLEKMVSDVQIKQRYGLVLGNIILFFRWLFNHDG